MKIVNPGIILWLTIPLAILLAIGSLTGILFSGIYVEETENWRLQAQGQDAIDLFIIVPCLLVTAVYAYRQNAMALLLWGGTLCFLIYTFLIYCFAVHFNSLFLVYIAILGLSFYSFVYFHFGQLRSPAITRFNNPRIIKIIAAYFLLIFVFFTFAWLSDIVPALLSNQKPDKLSESGLFTNPVHVIDLAVFLPGVFLTAVLLLRKESIALQLVPVILSFFVLMDITIATLIIIMNAQSIGENIYPVLAFIFLALFSSGLLLWFLQSARAAKGYEIHHHRATFA